MTYVEIKGRKIPATMSGLVKDNTWNDRSTKSIRCEMTYDEAVELFTDGEPWKIIYQGESYKDDAGETIVPDPVEYDNSDYCFAGPITDHRDGTLTIKMGKPTDLEVTTEERDQALSDLEDVLLIAYGGM